MIRWMSAGKDRENMVKDQPVKDQSGKLREHPTLRYLKRNYHYYILLVLPFLYFLIFRYGPIMGNILAFRAFRPGGSAYGEKWVGLTYFKMFLSDRNFWIAFKNTLVLSFSNLLFAFTLPIIFALLLNEIARPRLKGAIQTISYFPHFISAVVVVSMMQEFLSPTTGVVNKVLNLLGCESIFFMNEPSWFRPVFITSELWQHMGWNSIIYCAAIAGIDPQLYEAAAMDGAGRLRQVFSITLPQIAPTIAVVLIISVGAVMSVGFDKVLLMYTPSNAAVSDILDTYIYRMGIGSSNYSYATAVGLFSGVIGFILVSSTNYLSKKISGNSVY